MTDTADDSNKMALVTADNCLAQAADYVDLKLFDKAVLMYEKALSTLELVYGEDQPELDDCLNQLAFCFENSKRLNDALRIHARRLRTQEAINLAGDRTPVETLLKIAQINETLLRPADALVNIQQAVEAAKQNLSSSDPLYAHIMQRYQDMASMVEMQTHAGSAAPMQISVNPVQLVEPISVPGSDTAISDWETQAAEDLSFDKYREAAKNEDLVELARLNANRYDRDQGTKRSRTRAEGKRSLSALQLAREFALPALGLLTVVALSIFFLSRKIDLVPAAVSDLAVSSGNKAIVTRFVCADGSQEVRLEANHQALFVAFDKTVELPYSNFVMDWPNLFNVMYTAPTQKQIWADLKGSLLRTSENDIYYDADGPEAAVIAKMKSLAGYAQGYYLRCGEYPKSAANDGSGQLSFLNPFDHSANQIAIRAVPEKNNDGVDILKTLEAGQLTADESPYTPCQITCYAVQAMTDTGKGQRVKTTRFYVRGCDRSGAILSPRQAGKYFIVTAGNEYLTGPAAATVGKSATRLSKKAVASTALTSPVQKAEKPSRLWIASNTACPLSLLHFALPIGLAGLAIALFVLSQMKAVNMKGKTTTSGSKIAFYAAVALVIAALVVLYLQLVVLA